MRRYTVVLAMLMLWSTRAATGNRSAAPVGRSRGLSLLVVQTLVIGWLAVLPSQTAHAANCDGLPVTGGTVPNGSYTMTDDCLITGTLVIADGTTVTINGAGHTISGGGTRRVIHLQIGATLSLIDVSISDGNAGGGTGGGILNGGTLTLDGSSVSNSQAGGPGGGINNSGDCCNVAVLTLNNSTIAGNQAPGGAGIFNSGAGAVTVNNSVISENATTKSGSGGGILNQGGALTISDTTFSGNTAGGSGGALFTNFVEVEISNSVFSGNHAGGFGGGGIFAGGSGNLTVSKSTFSNNSTANHGGGIRNEGLLLVTDTTFSGNLAANGGGLSTHTAQQTTAIFATVDNSTFAGNTASNSGGGARNDGRLFITRSTFSGNTTSGHGGGIVNAHRLEVTNSTFSGNSAATFGGGIHNGGTVTATNSTIVGNSADVGGGINNAPFHGTEALNTIVADSVGGNCGGAFITTTSIADDATCPGFTEVTLAQLNLGALTGSPAYFPLLPGSVAIDAGTNDGCPPTDQPGNPRPQGPACDVGAFETSANQPPTADAGGPYTVDEGSNAQLTGSGSDPDDDPLTYAWDLDNDGIFETAGQNVTFSAADRDGPGTQVVVLEVCDDSSACNTDTATVDILNVAPTITAIAAPTDPVQVGTEITASGTFTDPGTPDTHTAEWDWGDGTISAGTVDQVTDSVSDVHTYTQPGVYTITLTVTDDDADSDTAIFEFVVVYDPEGGFVTGGGWIQSPEGAYTADPTLTGKAHFGFVSKYLKGATTPTGETEFQFQPAGLDFHSTEYEWLVVSGPKAQYKGSGTINGTGDYGFLITVNDGQAEGGGGVDRFRIKIWDKTTDEVVYDNQVGDGDTADATTQLRGGSIVIHKG